MLIIIFAGYFGDIHTYVASTIFLLKNVSRSAPPPAVCFCNQKDCFVFWIYKWYKKIVELHSLNGLCMSKHLFHVGKQNEMKPEKTKRSTYVKRMVSHPRFANVTNQQVRLRYGPWRGCSSKDNNKSCWWHYCHLFYYLLSFSITKLSALKMIRSNGFYFYFPQYINSNQVFILCFILFFWNSDNSILFDDINAWIPRMTVGHFSYMCN